MTGIDTLYILPKYHQSMVKDILSISNTYSSLESWKSNECGHLSKVEQMFQQAILNAMPFPKLKFEQGIQVHS